MSASPPTRGRKIRRPLLPADRKQIEKSEALRAAGLRLTALGKYSAATRAFRRALQLARGSESSDPLFLAAVLNDFGVLCKYSGRFAEARRMYLRAMKLVARADDDGENREEFTATLYHNLAGIAHSRGRYSEGLAYARRGLRIRRGIRPRDALSLAADEVACAAILADVGRHSEAARLYLRALGVFRRRLGDTHYEVGAVLTNLGALYWKTARAAAAERTLRRGLAIVEGALGRNHPRTASARGNLAFIRARRTKMTEEPQDSPQRRRGR